MACSCRSRKVDTVYSAQRQASVVKVQPQQAEPVQIPKTQETPVEKQPYNFDFSTEPDQLCVNCAMKHIAFASVLWLQSQTGLDKYLACGQLMCASYHYKQLTGPRSYYCSSIARYLMCNRQDTHKVKKLLQMAIQPSKEIPQDVWPQQMFAWNPPQGSLRLIDSLLELSTVYALLFAQMGYLELNRGFALGHLQRAVIYLQHQQQTKDKLKGICLKIRQLWKLVQQMTYMDDIYKQCRQRLQQILKTVIEVFQEQQV